jgi:mannonate dehydratase
MQLTFRWYGPEDPVPLAYIRQIPGVTGVVSALHERAPGEAWRRDDVRSLRETIEAAGLAFAVVESIPVHEEIKLGGHRRDELIERYARSIAAVGAEGIRVVCYNFMPVFDWLRTDLAMRLPDGSTTLRFEQDAMDAIDFSDGTGALPGWGAAYTEEELSALRAAYAALPEEELWANLAYFLERVVPVAASNGVRLAIHPDDPPWQIGLFPRIITSGRALERVAGLVNSPANGVTLCTGSLGSDPEEASRLPEVVHALGSRIHFVHARNVRTVSGRSFHESAHPSGDVDLPAVLDALLEIGFDGPMRPDHGRMIWGEEGRPGYGLYDRGLGAAYLLGLWHALSRRAGSARAR